MKINYLLLFAFSFSIFNSFGQTIPNASFEDWNSEMVWFEAPDFWWTNNNQLQTPVITDLEPYHGNYALKISHDFARDQGFAYSKFPFSSHPNNVYCFVKCSIDGLDTVQIYINVYSKGKIVDTGHWICTSSILSWTQQTISVSQNNSEVDSMSIYILGGLEKETSFSIDLFSLEPSTNEIINLEQNKSWNLYPNPTSDFTTLSYNNINNAVHTLKIYNIAGQLVRHIPNIKSDQVIIQKENLNKGLYFFKLQSNLEIVAAGKLIIN